MMKLNNQGIALIKNFEGLRLNAYRDVAGIWTIGYGSTRYHDGKTIKPGDKLTGEAQASALLANTLSNYTNAVNHLVKVPLNQNQFNALVSFAYNEGTGALERSTLLKKLNQLDYAAAANQFLLWDKITDAATGKKVRCKSLANRRKQERELFLKPLS
ncbi:lysozyme [Mucilaginibacter psychrotolerans]|uniref:Lysozyme n=1 Tax=Mucilaginibacter psychrotolerans TaxID=1524096 RepID=A0A4Y8S6C5_9SPHI|nr:lysozyme [Mucilaginibacter psychrotolerans]TFF34508.1 lysozyme [Mucilaginibacter psychrotolerans]